MSELSDLLIQKLRQDPDIPPWRTEFHFAKPAREFRADIAWPGAGLLVEVDGGTYARQGAKRCPLCKQVPVGRHNTGSGIERDFEKQNLAVIRGYRVMHFTRKSIESGEAVRLIRLALGIV